MNEKGEPDEEPNTIGALLVAAAETDDAPNEKTAGGDSLVEPKMEDFWGCHVESNTLEVGPLELLELVAEELRPKPELEPIGLGAGKPNGEVLEVKEPNGEVLELEEPNREVLDVRDVVSVVPDIVGEADEPN